MKLAVLVLGVLWSWPLTGWGCSVPVFRYALERWAADTYEVVVFHREPLTTNQAEIVTALEMTASNAIANLTVERVNLASEVSEPRQTLWKAQSNAALPWVVVQYPKAKEIEDPVWTGTLMDDALRTLVESPARREIARRLTKGESLVWLMLESGNRTSDDASVRLLEDESRKLENILKLPEPAPDDPPARSDLPLKIAFSTMRVSRVNPAEQMLINMLLRVDPSLTPITDPMVFAVIGRGRALPPLTGKTLSAEAIVAVAEFVTGACSCEVKSFNPGFDLLMAMDWDSALEGRMVKDPELPPLIGLAQFAALTNRPEALPLTNSLVAPKKQGPGIARNIVIVLVIFAAAVGTGTLLLKRKAAKASQP